VKIGSLVLEKNRFKNYSGVRITHPARIVWANFGEIWLKLAKFRQIRLDENSWLDELYLPQWVTPLYFLKIIFQN